MTDEEFAPPTIEAAASMIREYGKEHGLTPKELLDVFHVGIAVLAASPRPPEWLTLSQEEIARIPVGWHHSAKAARKVALVADFDEAVDAERARLLALEERGL